MDKRELTTQVNTINKVVKKRKKRMSGIEGKREIYGWIFALPWIIGLIVFYLYPMVSSAIFSFSEFKGFFPEKFNGLANYKDVISDPVFAIAVRNTLFYTFLAVPIGLIIGIVLASLLNAKVKGKSVYRVLVFIPTLMPAVTTGIIWQWLLNSQYGVVNNLLLKIGINGPPWFASEIWSKPSLVIIAEWTIGTTVLTYLAGLQDIPTQYYEAAKLDGANLFHQFKNITLPLLSPVIFFNIVMGIIGGMQQFTLPFVITNGSGTPANSMMFYGMLLYKDAFAYFKMGRANAMAWMMFVVVMALTAVITHTSKKWVYYMGD